MLKLCSASPSRWSLPPPATDSAPSRPRGSRALPRFIYLNNVATAALSCRAMPYARYTPRPPLSGAVACLWYWKDAPQGHSKEQLMPNGEASIIFNLREEPLRIYSAQDHSRFENYPRHRTPQSRAAFLTALQKTSPKSFPKFRFLQSPATGSAHNGSH
jgi:hypothetical protein